MSYQQTLHALAGRAEQAAVALWDSFDELGEELFVAALAAMLGIHNGRARSLAELAFAVELMAATGEPAAVAGLAIVDDSQRLYKAAGTVLEVAQASEAPESIIGRLGRSEPLNAAAQTYGELMADSELVEGWRRQLSPTACQLCQWWDRDGRVWPADHPFQHHNGCACTAEPVWVKHVRGTQYTDARRAS